MTRRQTGAAARRRPDRGSATLIETCFVFLPLFAVMLAIIDFSMVLCLRSTMQYACREATRFGITHQTLSGMGHRESVRTVARRNASGFLSRVEGSCAGGRACIEVNYYRPDGTLATNNPPNAPGNLIEVRVRNFRWGMLAPLRRDMTSLTLGSSSIDVLDGLPGGVNPPAAGS